MDTEKKATNDRYHHGNLRVTLLDSALEVLKEKGLAGFSMRDAARRAGVSQSAPKHHFGDARGLLGALAKSAYVQLGELLEAVDLAGLDVEDRVTALASVYVDYAQRNRALFDLMWRVTQFDIDDPALLEQKQRAMRALDRGIRGTDVDSLDWDDEALLPSYAVWSLVHGYATLALEGVIDHHSGAELKASSLLPAMLRRLDLR